LKPISTALGDLPRTQPTPLTGSTRELVFQDVHVASLHLQCACNTKFDFPNANSHGLSPAASGSSRSHIRLVSIITFKAPNQNRCNTSSIRLRSGDLLFIHKSN